MPPKEENYKIHFSLTLQHNTPTNSFVPLLLTFLHTVVVGHFSIWASWQVKFNILKFGYLIFSHVSTNDRIYNLCPRRTLLYFILCLRIFLAEEEEEGDRSRVRMDLIFSALKLADWFTFTTYYSSARLNFLVMATDWSSPRSSKCSRNRDH